jgi:hypothetical protein
MDISRFCVPCGTVTICLGCRLPGISSDRYPRAGRAAEQGSDWAVIAVTTDPPRLE